MKTLTNRSPLPVRHDYLLICLSLISLAGAAQPQQTASEKMALRQKFWELQQRIDQKDYSAFSDAADLPGSAGVIFIWNHAHSEGADPQMRPKALEAIKGTHGFKDYMQSKIGSITDREGDPSNEVRILAAIGNREAAEVLAPYLFDYRYPHSGEYMDGPIYNELAAEEMGKMHFGDAPTPDNWGGYDPEKLIAWQRWTIAHGMVPKEWIARVGIPDWQYKLAALDRRLRSRALEKSGQGQADPSDARRVGPLKLDRNVEASQTDSKTIHPSATGESIAMMNKNGMMRGRWVVWVSILAGVAALAYGLFVRSRRPKN